jgi:hypothetical protein
VRTVDDPTLIGYVPRYLAADVWQLVREGDVSLIELSVDGSIPTPRSRTAFSAECVRPGPRILRRAAATTSSQSPPRCRRLQAIDTRCGREIDHKVQRRGSDFSKDG